MILRSKNPVAVSGRKRSAPALKMMIAVDFDVFIGCRQAALFGFGANLRLWFITLGQCSKAVTKACSMRQ